MDTINHSQMQLLNFGGNARLQNFLSFYDLTYEPIQRRYHTQAAEYYRQKLKELVENGYPKTDIDFTQFGDKPSYDDGRKPLFAEQRPSITVLNNIENDAEALKKRCTMIISLNDEQILFKGKPGTQTITETQGS